MEMSESAKVLFTKAYCRYREACGDVTASRKEFLRTSEAARASLSNAVMSKVPGVPVTGVEHWDLEKAMSAASTLEEWGQAHEDMGRALIAQAAALRETAEVATSIIEVAKESING